MYRKFKADRTSSEQPRFALAVSFAVSPLTVPTKTNFLFFFLFFSLFFVVVFRPIYHSFFVSRLNNLSLRAIRVVGEFYDTSISKTIIGFYILHLWLTANTSAIFLDISFDVSRTSRGYRFIFICIHIYFCLDGCLSFATYFGCNSYTREAKILNWYGPPCRV